MMSTPKSTVLISGAGVAGPALALLLTRAGHRCTIVERAPTFRASGQQIDISGEAHKVIERMGVVKEIWAARVEDEGQLFVDAKDRRIAAFPAGDKGSLVKELEIMRADLVEVFFERTRKGVEYLLGEYVEEVRQDGEGVTVRFASSGRERRFDILIAADGLRSRTRKLAFDAGNTVLESKGMYASFMSIPWEETDGTWSRWYNDEQGLGKTVNIRPDEKRGTSSAYLSQCGPNVGDLAKGTLEEQKKRILEVFKNVGWETPRVLRAMAKDDVDFYGQEIAQAKSKSLSNGRVALLGDAGYCPSPLSGEGTSLALVGAYILAGCIATYPDVSEALAKYEEMVRPFVTSSQNLPPGVPWIANPQTATGVTIFQYVVWVVGLVLQTGVFTVLGKLGGLLPSFGSKPLALPDFPALASSG